MGLANSNAEIAKRYDRLAPFYRVIEIFFWLPPALRKRAVHLLALPKGGRAVEIGCGSGRNLPHLVRAVGPSGSVLGTDISQGMIDRAGRLARTERWSNVVLRIEDAAVLDTEPGVDGVLFSLSYSVIPERHAALQRAWNLLKPGGRLVILDSGTFTGVGKAVGRLGRTMSRFTVLGDPSIHPWEELARLSPATQHEFSTMGNYCLVWATREDA
jgi:ubiquinone/menaquinone biosynthesis C-methylase UbiE